MPFRSKIKKAFGGSEKADAPAGTTKSVTDAIAKKEKSAKSHWFNKPDQKWEDWPENVYKPHEVPAPKYKRPDKATQKGLDNYKGMAEATHEDDRRGSQASQYSPMGSRLASRRSSQEDPLGPGAAVEGVDPNEGKQDEEGNWPLTQVETARPAAAKAGTADNDRAESKDNFDSSELSRALTAIKDSNGPQAAAITA